MAEQAQGVLITGIGPLCALATGREEFWAALAEGSDELAQRIDAAWLRCEDFQVADYLESEKTYLDRCSQFTLAACSLAVRDAHLDWANLDHPRVGLSLGTAFGCLDSMLNNTSRVRTKGPRLASPVVFMHSFANTPASLAAIEYNIQGPTPTFCDGDISAGTALHYAQQALRCGQTDVMLAGGVEVLNNAMVAALSHEVKQPARVLAEGACVLVIEEQAFAENRGAPALAEVLSCAITGDRDPAAARQQAITQAGQMAELDEIPPVFEPPSAYGHSFGASLALDVAAAIGAWKCGEAPTDTAVIVRTTPDGRAAAIILRDTG